MDRTLGKGLRQMVQIGCTSVVAARMVGPEGVAERGSTLLVCLHGEVDFVIHGEGFVEVLRV